jgi:alkylhydroperoxidase/carboxymuconolactone decarboxylase family protein YurZ
VPNRFAAAKHAGASREEILETLYLAMRASARATWSMIKGSIEGIEEEVRRMKEQSEAEAAGAKR